MSSFDRSLKSYGFEAVKLAAEDEVQQLLAGCRSWCGDSSDEGCKDSGSRGASAVQALMASMSARMQPCPSGNELAMDGLGPVVDGGLDRRDPSAGPPASCRMRSAAAMSQSRALAETRPISIEPSATRASAARGRAPSGRRTIGPTLALEAGRRGLRAGDPGAGRASAARPRARRRCTRRPPPRLAS